jgi:hypothetical protein
MFENGNGVSKNSDEAAKWYELAADHGFLEAQYKLGIKQRPATPRIGTKSDGYDEEKCKLVWEIYSDCAHRNGISQCDVEGEATLRPPCRRGELPFLRWSR